MMPEKTILIVEDSPVDLKLLRFLLSQTQQFELLEASSMTGAIDMIQNTPEIHLILLDVRLPDGNGVDFCRQLKNDPATERIPVVLISAVERDDDSISRGLDAGADGYLTKPIEGNALRAWLRAALRISELEKEMASQPHSVNGDEKELLKVFAGLSHGVNNPLQNIMASVDLLSLELEKHPQSVSFLKEIQQYAEEASRLVARASIRARDRLTQRD